jgi:hypothetical protein
VQRIGVVCCAYCLDQSWKRGLLLLLLLLVMVMVMAVAVG